MSFPDPHLPNLFPQEDSLPLKANDLILKSMDQVKDTVFNRIDDLINELEQMKKTLGEQAALAKEVVKNHLNAQAGALEHTEEIRRNMSKLANGASPLDHGAEPEGKTQESEPTPEF